MQVHRACLALLAVAAAHERRPEHSVGSAADPARDIRALAASHGDQSELVRAARESGFRPCVAGRVALPSLTLAAPAAQVSESESPAPPPVPPPPLPPWPRLCDLDAPKSACKFLNDQACDDGGPGSEYDVCDFGSDCLDCGYRFYMPPSPPPTLEARMRGYQDPFISQMFALVLCMCLGLIVCFLTNCCTGGSQPSPDELFEQLGSRPSAEYVMKARAQLSDQFSEDQQTIEAITDRDGGLSVIEVTEQILMATASGNAVPEGWAPPPAVRPPSQSHVSLERKRSFERAKSSRRHSDTVLGRAGPAPTHSPVGRRLSGEKRLSGEIPGSPLRQSFSATGGKQKVLVPFAEIDAIAPDGPAAIGGLQLGDRLLKFGTVHAENHDGMQELTRVTQASFGTTIPLLIQRVHADGSTGRVLLDLAPRHWAGRGLLGCNIQELHPSEQVLAPASAPSPLALPAGRDAATRPRAASTELV